MNDSIKRLEDKDKKSTKNYKDIILVYIVPIANFFLLIYELIFNFVNLNSVLLIVLNITFVLNASNTGIACTMGGLKSYDENNELTKKRNISIVSSAMLFLVSYMLLKQDWDRDSINVFFANTFLIIIVLVFTAITSCMIIKDYVKVGAYRDSLVKADSEKLIASNEDKEDIEKMNNIEKGSMGGVEYDV